MAQAPRKKKPSSSNAPCLYTLRIELQPDELHPLTWRQLQVDGRISLGKLHHFIQAAFGWTDAHLHEFVINGRTFATPDREDEFYQREVEDERQAFLNRLVSYGSAFLYRYDFGDNWEHFVIVEKVEQDLKSDPYGGAWIIDGAGACPPEDVGGVPGYHNFLQTLQTEPDSDEALDLLEWAGGAFDPHQFDRRAANAAIQRMLWNRWGDS